MDWKSLKHTFLAFNSSGQTQIQFRIHGAKEDASIFFPDQHIMKLDTLNQSFKLSRWSIQDTECIQYSSFAGKSINLNPNFLQEFTGFRKN